MPSLEGPEITSVRAGGGRRVTERPSNTHLAGSGAVLPEGLRNLAAAAKVPIAFAWDVEGPWFGNETFRARFRLPGWDLDRAIPEARRLLVEVLSDHRPRALSERECCLGPERAWFNLELVPLGRPDDRAPCAALIFEEATRAVLLRRSAEHIETLDTLLLACSDREAVFEAWDSALRHPSSLVPFHALWWAKEDRLECRVARGVAPQSYAFHPFEHTPGDRPWPFEAVANAMTRMQATGTADAFGLEGLPRGEDTLWTAHLFPLANLVGGGPNGFLALGSVAGASAPMEEVEYLSGLVSRLRRALQPREEGLLSRSHAPSLRHHPEAVYRLLWKVRATAIVVFDKDDRLQLANPSASELIGRPLDLVAGLSLGDLGLPEPMQELFAIFKGSLDREGYYRRSAPQKCPFNTPAGLRYMEIAFQQLRIAREDFIACLMMDVTERESNLALLRERESRVRTLAEELQTMTRSLVEIQEQERRLLSRELHDRIGQNLTALGLNLDIIEMQTEHSTSDLVAARLKDSRDLLTRTVEDIDNLTSELRPQMLDDYGLLPALEWYAEEWQRRSRVSVHLRARTPIGRLKPEVEIGLFRIAQEALNNVSKHAKATRVTFTFLQTHRRLRMLIDNDHFDPSGPLKKVNQNARGAGLVIMRERAEAFSGQLHAWSSPDDGFTVRVDIPVE